MRVYDKLSLEEEGVEKRGVEDVQGIEEAKKGRNRDPRGLEGRGAKRLKTIKLNFLN
jgi:hypothetical protein